MPIDGRIYKSAPTTQSAALLCPYRFNKFDGAGWLDMQGWRVTGSWQTRR